MAYHTREPFTFPGRITGATTLKNGQVLLAHEKYYENELKFVLYHPKKPGAPWSVVRVIGSYDVKRWVSKNDIWTANAFLALPWYSGNQYSDHYLVGHTKSPQFKVHSLNGTKRGTIRFKGVDLEVTQEQKTWVTKAYAGYGAKVSVPKKNPTYRWGMPVGTDRYLVLYTYTNGASQGAILNGLGTVLQKFAHDFGENGYLDAFGDRIIYYDANEEVLALTSPVP